MLAPNCLTSIDLIGGPNVDDSRLVEFGFELINEKILSIDKVDNRLYQINAKAKGRMAVKFFVRLPNKNIISSVITDIVIEDPNQL